MNAFTSSEKKGLRTFLFKYKKGGADCRDKVQRSMSNLMSARGAKYGTKVLPSTSL